MSVQKAAGCIIGEDYPKPIVDHDVMRKKNIERMAAAYKSGKEGGDSNPSGSTNGNLITTSVYVFSHLGITAKSAALPVYGVCIIFI